MTPVWRGRVFRLQAGEDQVGFSAGWRQRAAAPRRGRRGAEIVAVDVEAAVCAFGQGLAESGANALRAGADHDHFAAMMFLELQGFFKA